jgi:hypothetical protein
MPKCEECGEGRLAALTVHHLEGKHIKAFKTLCFNCHMLEHSKTPNYAAADYFTEFLSKTKLIDDRDTYILSLHFAGLSLRSIGRLVVLSHVRVGEIIRDCLAQKAVMDTLKAMAAP